MNISNSPIILDACCVLNFYSTGRFSQILGTLPTNVYVSEVVKRKELLTLQSVDCQFGFSTSQFDEAIKQNVILLTDFETDSEQEDFVSFTVEMKDDGESATFSIASNRNWSVATDDKKAISFAQKTTPQVSIFSTLQIVKFWFENSQADSSELKAVLENIDKIGSYVPGKNHPLYNWWLTSL